MSETAPEPAPRPAGGSFLTRKYGPLPGWGWAALGGALAGGYYLWRKKSASSAAPATTATDNSNPDNAPDISAIQSEVQQLQGAASTDVARDTAEAGKETKTAAQLAAEKKKDASEAKQLDNAQKRIAALRREEHKEHPARRRSPAAKGGRGERRKK